VRLLKTAQRRFEMRIIAFCLMPNHWHLLLWPQPSQSLAKFMHWVGGEHARRWAIAHDAVGRGAVYQGRYKAIPIQTGKHLLIVWRYVERNPLRAHLVKDARAWTWSSLTMASDPAASPELTCPLVRPDNWCDVVNEPQTRAELLPFRRANEAGAPFGDEAWIATCAGQTGWRRHGRPKRGRTPF